jgi:hypothetical protein
VLELQTPQWIDKLRPRGEPCMEIIRHKTVSGDIDVSDGQPYESPSPKSSTVQTVANWYVGSKVDIEFEIQHPRIAPSMCLVGLNQPLPNAIKPLLSFNHPVINERHASHQEDPLCRNTIGRLTPLIFLVEVSMNQSKRLFGRTYIINATQIVTINSVANT